MRFFTACLLIAANTLTLTSALGINCRGDGSCAGIAGNLGNLEAYSAEVAKNNVTHTYANGDHITCVQSELGPGLCAFLQHTPSGLTGDKIQPLIDSLQAHGCKKCGSIPIGYPGSNDPSGGILTVNEVEKTNGCNGVCHPGQ